MASWAKRIWSGTGSTLQCSEHFCSVQSVTPSIPCLEVSVIRSEFNLSSHFSLRGLYVWLLVAAPSPAQPSMLDAKHCLPFMVPPGLYRSTFSIAFSKHPHIPVEEYFSGNKIGFETWSSPGSNIIGLRVLCSTSREVHIRLHEVCLQVVFCHMCPKTTSSRPQKGQ